MTTLTKIGRPTSAETQHKRVLGILRASGKVARRNSLPEYLEQSEINAMLQCAPQNEDGTPNVHARLLMLIMWRAGLRISEALSLTAGDLRLNDDRPTLKVLGKRNKERVVPIHPELRVALINYLSYNGGNKTRGLFTITRSTGWRWVAAARDRAQDMGMMAHGRKVTPHTFRHSAARHWLANGVPVNKVSLWLGHASL